MDIPSLQIRDIDTAMKNAFLTLPNVFRDILKIVRSSPVIFTPYLLVTTIAVIQLFSQLEIAVVNNVITLITIFLISWGNGVIYIEAHNTLSDEESITDPWKTSFYRIPTLIGTMVATGVIVLMGFFFFVIPGLYMSLKLTVAAPASVVNENNSILQSLQQSYEETTGHLILILTIFGAASFVIAPVFLVTAQFSPLFALLGMIIVGTLFVAPFIQIVAALLYVRLRQENRDSG